MVILARRYRGRAKTASDRSSRFAILIATILSARTRDETTTAAADRLLRRYPTPQQLAIASVKDVVNLIRPVGFFQTKARYVIATARELSTRFQGRVPSSLEDLLSLPGVGRKTANVVRNYAFHLAAIAVDTHVHRISNRLGWVRTDTPKTTERELEHVVPREMWRRVNDLLVKFGKDICRPIAPQCWRCPVMRFCAYPDKVLSPRIPKARSASTVPGLCGSSHVRLKPL